MLVLSGGLKTRHSVEAACIAAEHLQQRGKFSGQPQQDNSLLEMETCCADNKEEEEETH